MNAYLKQPVSILSCMMLIVTPSLPAGVTSEPLFHGSNYAQNHQWRCFTTQALAEPFISERQHHDPSGPFLSQELEGFSPGESIDTLPIVSLAQHLYGNHKLPKPLEETAFHRASEVARYAREMYAVLGKPIPPDVEAAAYLSLAGSRIRKIKDKKKFSMALRLVENADSVQKFLYRPPPLKKAKTKTHAYKSQNLWKHMNMVVSQLDSLKALVLATAQRLAALKNHSSVNYDDIYREVIQCYARLFARSGSYALDLYVLGAAFKLAHPDKHDSALRMLDAATQMTEDERQVYVHSFSGRIGSIQEQPHVIKKAFGSVKGPYSFMSKTNRRKVEEITDLLRFSVILQQPEDLHDAVLQIMEQTGWTLPDDRAVYDQLESKFRDDHFPVHITLVAGSGSPAQYHEVQFFKNSAHYYNYLYGAHPHWAHKVGMETDQSFEGYEQYDVTDDPDINFERLKKAVGHSVYFQIPEDIEMGSPTYSTLSIPRNTHRVNGNLADVAALPIFDALDANFSGFKTGRVLVDLILGREEQTISPAQLPSRTVQNGDLIIVNQPQQKASAKKDKLVAAMKTASSPRATLLLAEITDLDYAARTKDGMELLKKYLGLSPLLGNFSQDFLAHVVHPASQKWDLSDNELLAVLCYDSEHTNFAVWEELKSAAISYATEKFNRAKPPELPPEFWNSKVPSGAIAESYGLKSGEQVALALAAGLIAPEGLIKLWRHILPHFGMGQLTDIGRSSTNQFFYELRIPDHAGLLLGLRSCLVAAGMPHLQPMIREEPNGVPGYKMINIRIVVPADDPKRNDLEQKLIAFYQGRALLREKPSEFALLKAMVTYDPSVPAAEWDVFHFLAQEGINLSSEPRKMNNGVTEMLLGLPPTVNPDYLQLQLASIPGVQGIQIKLSPNIHPPPSRLTARERLEGLGWAALAGVGGGLALTILAQLLNMLDLDAIGLTTLFWDYALELGLGVFAILAGYVTEEILFHEAGHIRAARETYPQAGLLRWSWRGSLVVVKDKHNKANPELVDNDRVRKAGPAGSQRAAVVSAYLLMAALSSFVLLRHTAPHASMGPLVLLIESVVYLCAVLGAALCHRDADKVPLQLPAEHKLPVDHVTQTVSSQPDAFLMTLMDELREHGFFPAFPFRIVKTDDGDAVTVSIRYSGRTLFASRFSDVAETVLEAFKSNPPPSPEKTRHPHRRLLDLDLKNPAVISDVIETLRDHQIVMESAEPIHANSTNRYRCVLAGPDDSGARPEPVPAAGLVIRQSLEAIKDVSHVTLQDFTCLQVSYNSGTRELRILNANNREGVLERLLSELSANRLAIDSITVRRSAGGELSSVLVLDATTLKADSVLHLLEDLKHIEFPPLDHEPTSQERELTLSFELLNQPFTFLEVVRVLTERHVNIEPTADLLTMPGDSPYGRAELLISTDLSILELEHLVNSVNQNVQSEFADGARPIVRNIEVAVHAVSKASAMEAARRLRAKMKAELGPIGWTDARLVAPMRNVPGEEDGTKDTKIFLPNLDRALRLQDMAHANPFRLASQSRPRTWLAQAALTLSMANPFSLRLTEEWPPAYPHYRQTDYYPGQPQIPYVVHTEETAHDMIALGERDPLSIIEAPIHDVIEDAKKNVWAVLEHLIRDTKAGHPWPSTRVLMARFRYHFPDSADRFKRLEKWTRGSGEFNAQDEALLKADIESAVEEMCYQWIRENIQRYPEMIIDDLKALSQDRDYDSYAGNLRRQDVARRLRLKLVEQANNLVTLTATKAPEIVAKNVRYFLPVALSKSFLLNPRNHAFAQHYLKRLMAESLHGGPLVLYIGENKETGKNEDPSVARAKMLQSLGESLSALRDPSLRPYLPVQELAEGAVQQFIFQLEQLQATLTAAPTIEPSPETRSPEGIDRHADFSKAVSASTTFDPRMARTLTPRGNDEGSENSYENIVKEHKPFFEQGTPLTSLLATLIRENGKAVYVDVGPGYGLALRQIKKRLGKGLMTYGVDLMNWRELHGKELAEFLDQFVEAADFDLLSPQFSYTLLSESMEKVHLPESADLITAIYAVNYSQDPIAALIHLFEQLKIGGFLIATIPENISITQIVQRMGNLRASFWIEKEFVVLKRLEGSSEVDRALRSA